MASTPLLGLSLPADGTTNWGTLVNTSITALLDSAIAGTTTLSSDADVTLTTTTEASNQARQAILLCTGSRTSIKTITAPASSKTYIVINNTSGGYGVKVVGVGPTSGITVPSGKAYQIAWNGSDFVTTSTTTINLATDVSGTLPIANGGTGQTTQQAAINALVGTQTANRVLRSDGTNSTLAQVVLTTDVTGTLPIGSGGTGQTTANAAFNALAPSQASANGRYLKSDGTNASWDAIDISTSDVTGTLPTANGGTGLTSFTANGVMYASSTSALTTGSALTFDGNILTNSNGAIRASGATVPSSGAGLELLYGASGAGISTVLSYDRGASAYKPLWIDGSYQAYFISGSEQMRLTSTGLGIGTSSPTQRLDVRAAAGGIYLNSTTGTNQVALQTNNSGGDFYFGIDNSVGNNFNTGTAYAGVLWRSGANPICFVNNSTERMRLDSSGNLGIGTSSPAQRLEARNDFNGSTWIKITNTNSGSGARSGLLLANDVSDYGSVELNSTNNSPANALVIRTSAAYPIAFSTNNTERMRLDSSGNLGLGVTPSAWSTTGNLQLKSGSNISAGTGIGLYSNGYFNAGWKYIDSTYATGYGQSGGSHLWYIAASGTAGNTITFTQAMTLDASGNLLVGTTAQPSASVYGSAFIAATESRRVLMMSGDSTATSNRIEFFNPNGSVGKIDVSGSSTTYATSSDYRLKKDVQPMTGALAKVAALKPVTYKWKVDDSAGEGFIAHELAEVVPQCVTGEKDAINEDGSIKPQAIDTSFLVATLTAAIQELKAEVDSLKAQLKGA